MSSGDKRKTKATLTEELGCLRLRIDELEKQEEARKQAEADLKVSEERYRLLAENATDVIFAFDNDLRLTYLSPSAQRMFGYSFEESQSIPLEKVFTPETLKKVNIISEAAKEAEPAIDKGKLKPLTIEIEVNRKDGSLIWCEVKSTFMFDNNDRVLGYTGVVRDITERKQVELDLKETMKQLQTVSDGIVDGLIIADTKKGGILSVNTAICTMLGYSETELLSMSIVDIHPRDQVNWIIKEVSKKTSGYMTNIPFLRKDGSVFFADIGARNIFFMGQSCAIGFIKDVTDRKKGEEALRESEEKFRELAELLPEIVFEIDDRGNLTFTNRHAEKITGYGLKDVEKKIKAIDILIPEDRDRGIQNILTVLRGEVPGNSEYTIQRKDGSTFAVIIRSAPVIKDGVPAGVRGIIIDISGRKAAEDALKESEKNYKALFNTSPESISLLSLDGTVLDCNKSSEELFGFTREEIIGRPFEASAAFRYEKALDLMDIRNKVLADEDVEPFETSMTKVGGQKGWVDIFPSLLKKDGKPYAIQIIARDITGRKIANAALRESEQKFRDLAELLPEMLCEVDEQGNITYINRMAFKVFGYSREDLEKGLNAMDMVVPEDLDRARKHMAKVLKGRYQGGIEFTARRKDGLTFPIVVYANPRIQANKSVGMRMIIIDNTERKKVEDELRETKEQAEAANLAMSEFLAMMSHEIRTPLNSIIGFGGLMMETELTPEQSEYSESMQHSGKILLGIINDILDFSKIEDGKLDIESEPFDLHETINEVVNLMEPGAKAHGLELHFRYAPEMPFNFIGDGGRIHQVLINLVDNAVKFTSAGHITISVERLENVNDGDEALLRLEVEDTGIGIPEEKIELIFNKFTQAESYTSRRYGGSGLGLAISKKLAELMGGGVGGDKPPGEGLDFLVHREPAGGQPGRDIFRLP